MSGECDSSPTSGCKDMSFLSEITIGNQKVEEKLTQINEKLESLLESQQQCCTETNSNLETIKDRLSTLIENGQECCDETNANLTIIAGLLATPVLAGIHVEFKGFVCAQMLD